MSEKPPEKRTQSGEVALDLMTVVEAQPQPVEAMPTPRAPSVSPQIEIDPAKLLGAWDANTAVLRQLVDVISETAKSNQRVQIDNARTRTIVAACGAAFVLINLGMVLALFFTVRDHTRRSIAVAEAALSIAEGTAKDAAATLKAVRSVSKALGAKVEADSALTPDAEANAQAAAVEAQAVAIQAEKTVSNDPAVKQKANVELEVLRVKAKRLQVQVNVDTDGGKP